MTMYHHDSRDLNSAVIEAGEYLKQSIRQDAARAQRGFVQLQERVIRDQLMPLSDLSFQLNQHQLSVNSQGITNPALGQLCNRVGLRVDFAKRLMNHPNVLARNLAVENFETLSAISEDTVMLRSVDGVYRGVVSDAYKRMDTGIIAGAFAQEFKDASLLPVQCTLSETRSYVRAVMPRIYGAEFGEALCFGLTLRASDFGFGKVELAPFCQRVWCSNRAQMSLSMGGGFSKTHRGARMTEETFELSAGTQELQLAAMASEMRDGIKALLSPESINTYVSAIGRCFAEAQRGGQFAAEKEIEKLVKAAKLTAKQATFVTETYNTNDRDVAGVGAGRWKLSQAIAYAAHAMGLEADAAMDLEYLAGEIVASAPAGAILAASN